jgi:hypothetical protein
MKKLSVIAVAAALAGLGLAACGSSPASHQNSLSSPSASATHSASAAPKPTKPKPVALPGIGQPVRAGIYTFTVTKFQCGLHEVTAPPIGGVSEPSGTSRPAHGQFCVAMVREQNVSHAPQPIPFDATIKSASGSTYDNDTDPMVLTNAQLQYLGGNSTVAAQVNPGTSNSDVFVWDVPASVQASSVTISSGYTGSGSGTVSVTP